MRISIISGWYPWSFWSGAEKGSDGTPPEIVAKVSLDRTTHLSKRGGGLSVTTSTFSPLRLLLLAHLFWAVRGQGLGPFPAEFDVTTLDGTNGFVIPGEFNGNRFGYSVSSAGDFNGDGLSDIMVGSYAFKPEKKNNAGKVYIIFGNRTSFSGGTFNLADLNGSNGFTIDGEQRGDNFGYSLSTAGDMNGDSVSDIVIGALRASPFGRLYAGKGYVIFGTRKHIPGGQFDLSTLNGINGFEIPGAKAGDRFGVSVSSAGDFNGDDLADILIGASRAAPSGKVDAGGSYMLFGRRTPMPGGQLDLSTLNGTNGFFMPGEGVDDRNGIWVSSVGDLNGDGLEDIVIGAYLSDPSGKEDAGTTYVLYGTNAPIKGGQFDLNTLNGTNGFSVPGEVAGDLNGRSVSSAGDINGDGLNDIVIGAFSASPENKIDVGKSYVLYGSLNRIPKPSLNLSELNGKDGFSIPGVLVGERLGYSVSSAGDTNGDGIDDLLLGASPGVLSEKNLVGKTYVLFGSKELLPSSHYNLSTLNGLNGFVISGELHNDGFGYDVSSTSDFNGDGLSDIVIGAYNATYSGNNRPGLTYVIFGRNQLNILTLPQTPHLSTITSQPKNPTTTDSSSTASSRILATTIDATSTHSASSLHSSNTATVSHFVVGSSPASSAILIGVIVAGVITCACSILGGFALMLKKRSGAKEEASSSQPIQTDPAIPADYVDISQLAPEMRSARVENEYAIIQPSQPSHYKQWPSKPVLSTTNNYDDVDLEKLNAQMGQYEDAKKAQLHDGYDDLPTV